MSKQKHSLSYDTTPSGDWITAEGPAMEKLVSRSPRRQPSSLSISCSPESSYRQIAAAKVSSFQEPPTPSQQSSSRQFVFSNSSSIIPPPSASRSFSQLSTSSSLSSSSSSSLSSSTKSRDPRNPSEVFPPIPISRFHDHVQGRNKKDPNAGYDQFDLEFEVLRQLDSKQSARMYRPTQATKSKNRYCNILPNEHTRVKLKPFDNDPSSDYINASFVKSVLDGNKFSFIAASAPLPNTIADWWRMIDEQDIRIIIMLTREKEPRDTFLQANVYWPQTLNSKQQYGDNTVTLMKEVECGDCILRTFMLQSPSRQTPFQVEQIQYLGWSDHSIPTEMTSFQSFMEIYRSIRTEHGDPKSPILVHCSAGVGRTGTFIAIDFLLDNLEAHFATSKTEPSINVFHVVFHLRESRPGMVQQKSQYVFIFQFIDYCLQKGLFTPFRYKQNFSSGSNSISLSDDDDDDDDDDDVSL